MSVSGGDALGQQGFRKRADDVGETARLDDREGFGSDGQDRQRFEALDQMYLRTSAGERVRGRPARRLVHRLSERAISNFRVTCVTSCAGWRPDASDALGTKPSCSWFPRKREKADAGEHLSGTAVRSVEWAHRSGSPVETCREIRTGRTDLGDSGNGNGRRRYNQRKWGRLSS